MVRFKAICWEPGVVHIQPEKQAKVLGPFKQTLCGRMVPTAEELPVTGNISVCSHCRRVQDLVLRGHSPERARATLAGVPLRERKRGRHGGREN